MPSDRGAAPFNVIPRNLVQEVLGPHTTIGVADYRHTEWPRWIVAHAGRLKVALSRFQSWHQDCAARFVHEP